LSSNSNQPGEGSRRRIVIPLHRDQPDPGLRRATGVKAAQKGGGKNSVSVSPRRSRLGKILAVCGIIIVVIVVLMAGGVFFWWQHYKTTPEYSLAVLVDAAQRNDMATVDTIIDSDKVIENFAGQVTDKAASRYGVALGGGLRKQIESMSPQLLQTIRDNARAALTTRVKEISQQADNKPFILIALGLPYLMNVAVSGDTAKATATVHDQQVELDMSRAANGWKVVAFRDDALVQRAIDQVIKDLPVIGLGKETRTPDARKRNRGLPPIRDLRIP
jgi:hypothetical protein